MKKREVQLEELVGYLLLFFVPISIFFFLSKKISVKLAPILQTSTGITSQILMVIFMFLLFFLVIPIVRKREDPAGVRLVLMWFVVVGFFMALPSLIVQKNFAPLLGNFVHLANYVLLTFLYSPEVLGIGKDIKDWFKHHRQILILVIYLAIILFYVFGFAWMNYQIYDHNPNSFNMPDGSATGYGTFIYYTSISFATIGYGDISPLTAAPRLLSTIISIIGTTVNVLFIAILLVYISSFQAKIFKEEEKVEKEEKKLEEEFRKMKRR